MSLPNIDISPILDWGWAILQFAMNYVVLLCILVFVIVLLAGAGDILGEIVRSWRRKDKSPRRVQE